MRGPRLEVSGFGEYTVCIVWMAQLNINLFAVSQKCACARKTIRSVALSLLPCRTQSSFATVSYRWIHDVWSFSFRLYCFDTEAGLTSQCCNKYLYYWQPANLTHTHTHTHTQHRVNEGSTSWMSTLLILNAYPTVWMHTLQLEWVPCSSWMPTLQWPPQLGLSFRRFCTMHMVNLLNLNCS